MKQISVNWVHFQKVDHREQALKVLALAKKQESEKQAKNRKK